MAAGWLERIRSMRSTGSLIKGAVAKDRGKKRVS